MHMGIHVKSLRSLFCNYKSSLRIQSVSFEMCVETLFCCEITSTRLYLQESHSLSRYTPIPAPTQPSIQIIINNDDLQKSRSQLQPTIRINDKSFMNSSFQNTTPSQISTPLPQILPHAASDTKSPIFSRNSPPTDKTKSESDRFYDLNIGMKQLKCQISSFFPETSSPTFKVSASPVATSSPTKERHSDGMSDISLSPIKDETYFIAEHLNNDMNKPIGQHETERHTDNSFRRKSIVSTITKLKESGKVPEHDAIADEIVEIMNLDVDVSGLLDFLENRIEINMDKIDCGDTVVNALAGVENNIEFKFLQVEALRKAMRKDIENGIVTEINTPSRNSPLEQRRLSSSDDEAINQLTTKIITELRDISRSPIPRKEQSPDRPEQALSAAKSVIDNPDTKNKLSISKKQLLSFFSTNLPESHTQNVPTPFEPLTITEEDEPSHTGKAGSYSLSKNFMIRKNVIFYSELCYTEADKALVHKCMRKITPNNSWSF